MRTGEAVNGRAAGSYKFPGLGSASVWDVIRGNMSLYSWDDG